MRSYFDMLKQPNLTKLWGSQVLSAIGDQLHMIAVLWISVQVAGAQAGFVVSAGSLTGLVVGLFAGTLADRWDRRWSMIFADLLRALTIAALAVAAQTGALQLWQIAAASVICSALGCLFDPCLMASIPALTDDANLLRAMNALMMMTFRIARLVGPGIAAALLAFCPIYSFFYIDSLSFVLSSVAIWSLGSRYRWRAHGAATARGARAILDDIRSAAILAVCDANLFGIMLISLFGGGLWCLVYMIGLPLLVKQSHLGSGVGAYATLICFYGVGNVISNVFVGLMELDKRPVFSSGLGTAVLGIGFGICACAPNIVVACCGCAIAAAGGPLGDVAAVNFFQRQPDHFRGKINSLSRFTSNLGSCIGLVTAPALFSLCSGRQGVTIGAGSMLLIGSLAMLFQPRGDRSPTIVATAGATNPEAEFMQSRNSKG